MLRIDSRFRGPPASGNGGYVAGLVAEALGGSDCEVTLRRPPPLDRDLELRLDVAGCSLWNGDELVASAAPGALDLAPPPLPPPGLEEAEGAAGRYTGFTRHPFPGCFVCGPDRDPGDGLRIFAGRLHEAAVASPWSPTPDLCDGDGLVEPRFLWAALDCPCYFAVQEQAGPAVLGRLAVHLGERPRCGAALVVVGWPIGSDGRKHRAGTALYAEGRPIAFGQAIWISIGRGSG